MEEYGTCPVCGTYSQSYSQRLIIDECGHQKCRRCLLVEESSCSQCYMQSVPVTFEPGVREDAGSLYVERSTPVESRSVRLRLGPSNNYQAIRSTGSVIYHQNDIRNSPFEENHYSELYDGRIIPPRPVSGIRASVIMKTPVIRTSPSVSGPRSPSSSHNQYERRNHGRSSIQEASGLRHGPDTQDLRLPRTHGVYVEQEEEEEEEHGDLYSEVSDQTLRSEIFDAEVTDEKARHLTRWVHSSRFAARSVTSSTAEDGPESPSPAPGKGEDVRAKEVINRGKLVSKNFLNEIMYALEVNLTENLPHHIQLLDDPNTFHCIICSKIIKKGRVKYHRNCNLNNGLTCALCSRQFKTSSHLVYHTRSQHTGERPFKCKLCPKSFFQVVKLNRHLLIHTGERPFSCDLCNKQFRTNYHLKEHRNIHTEENHHVCDVCQRSFADSNNFRRHMRLMHTEGKAFLCKVVSCRKRFRTKYDLRSHKQECHTPIYPSIYHCEICKRNFASERFLERHMRIHRKQRFGCDVCKEEFDNLEEFEKHKDHLHPDEGDQDDPMEVSPEATPSRETRSIQEMMNSTANKNAKAESKLSGISLVEHDKYIAQYNKTEQDFQERDVRYEAHSEPNVPLESGQDIQSSQGSDVRYGTQSQPKMPTFSQDFHTSQRGVVRNGAQVQSKIPTMSGQDFHSSQRGNVRNEPQVQSKLPTMSGVDFHTSKESDVRYEFQLQPQMPTTSGQDFCASQENDARYGARSLSGVPLSTGQYIKSSQGSEVGNRAQLRPEILSAPRQDFHTSQRSNVSYGDKHLSAVPISSGQESHTVLAREVDYSQSGMQKIPTQEEEGGHYEVSMQSNMPPAPCEDLRSNCLGSRKPLANQLNDPGIPEHVRLQSSDNCDRTERVVCEPDRFTLDLSQFNKSSGLSTPQSVRLHGGQVIRQPEMGQSVASLPSSGVSYQEAVETYCKMTDNTYQPYAEPARPGFEPEEHLTVKRPLKLYRPPKKTYTYLLPSINQLSTLQEEPSLPKNETKSTGDLQDGSHSRSLDQIHRDLSDREKILLKDLFRAYHLDIPQDILDGGQRSSEAGGSSKQVPEKIQVKKETYHVKTRLLNRYRKQSGLDTNSERSESEILCNLTDASRLLLNSNNAPINLSAEQREEFFASMHKILKNPGK